MFDFITKRLNKKPLLPYSSRYFPSGGIIPPEYTTRDYLRSYSDVGWWHAVVFRIALGMSEVQWNLSDVVDRNKPKQVFDHPVLNLLHLCNPYQTSEELIALDTIYMESLGESFWVLNYNGKGEPAEIVLAYPDLMSVIPAQEFPFIKGYVYGIGENAVPLDTKEVIHFKYPNPLNQFRGLGQAAAIGVNLSAERNADKWVDQFFYNSARPDGVIQFDYSLSDEQFDKLKKQWGEKYRGVNKAHQVALLEGGGKYVQIQNSVKDMDFPNLKQKNRDIILGIEGMPLSVMGITENVNRCLSENHRIFTENGLKHFADLVENDKVLTFNPESRQLEFQKPINIYSYDYDDDLIIFHNTRIHAEVTPNHRLYIAGSNCRKPGSLGSWGFKQAMELEDMAISHWLMASGKPILRESESMINIPKVEYVRTGKKGNEPDTNGYNVDSILLASFCGLIGSEGWLTRGTGKGIGFGCSLGSKALNSFEQIINLLPFGEWHYYDRPNSSKNGMRLYQVANKSLWTWLLENVGAGAKNKHVPEFVLRGSPEIMQSFLDTYIEGDGHICNKNNTILIRSHSPTMIDELLQLAIMLGYHASISGKTGVIISKGETSYFRNKHSIHREHYHGKVWCVEIPNGIFFTECNGKVHATGNSNAEAGDYTFARWVLKPRLDWKKAKLQEQLLPKFKNSQNLKLGFDEIVPETAEQKRLDAESGMRAGYLTVNEARIATGKDPLPSNVGDVLLLPLNLIPTSIHETIQPPPAPAPVGEAPEETPEESEEETHEDEQDAPKGFKGGEGSGNFDHEGRPGEVGGSGDGGGGGTSGGDNPSDVDGGGNENGEGGNSGSDWQNSLSDKEKGHIRAWREGDEYKNIRDAERGIGRPEDIARAEEFNVALDKDGSYKGITYRGAKLDDGRFQELGGIVDEDSEDYGKITAKEITLKASASASPRESVASGFTYRGKGDHRVLFRIDGKTGVDLSSIDSLYDFEKEVILRKGTTYTVTSSSYENRLTTIDLKEK